MGKIKLSFKQGLRLGLLRKYLKKERVSKNYSALVYADLKYANGELIDYLLNIEKKDFKGVLDAINIWLSLHAKSTNYEPIKYLIGDGENIFKTVEIEKELFSRKK